MGQKSRVRHENGVGVSQERLGLPEGELECLRLIPSPLSDKEENRPRTPLLFLHEGLGCVAMWRSFPRDLVAASGREGFLYSRFGYGASDPRPLPWPMTYMHAEARQVLPALLPKTGFDNAILVGHSDGASIALIHAGAFAGQTPITALILLAPHSFVEPISLASIQRARGAYHTTALRERLARYHGDNVDIAFRGWNDVWLHPAFRHWDITEFVRRITIPILVVQGKDDPYGTEAQVTTVAQLAQGPVTTAMIPDCGHSPHLDQPEATLAAITDFLAGLP